MKVTLVHSGPVAVPSIFHSLFHLIFTSSAIIIPVLEGRDRGSRVGEVVCLRWDWSPRLLRVWRSLPRDGSPWGAPG